MKVAKRAQKSLGLNDSELLEIMDLMGGPAQVIEGPHAGRIGMFDDEGIEEDEESGDDVHVAFVHFGVIQLTRRYQMIPLEHLRPATMEALMTRLENLHRLIALQQDHDLEARTEWLSELQYIDSVLVNRMIDASFFKARQGKNVFISYSSKDEQFASRLASDLRVAGHTPWLGEWEIKVGQSIIEKISKGIDGAHCVIVILTEHAIASKWVEREWQPKYWDEVRSGRTQVLPVLYRDCEIPPFLKTKKYADCRGDYNAGLKDILLALNSLDEESPEPSGAVRSRTRSTPAVPARPSPPRRRSATRR